MTTMGWLAEWRLSYIRSQEPDRPLAAYLLQVALKPERPDGSEKGGGTALRELARAAGRRVSKIPSARRPLRSRRKAPSCARADSAPCPSVFITLGGSRFRRGRAHGLENKPSVRKMTIVN
jgi:hypothetical protein